MSCKILRRLRGYKEKKSEERRREEKKRKENYLEHKYCVAGINMIE